MTFDRAITKIVFGFLLGVLIGLLLVVTIVGIANADDTPPVTITAPSTTTTVPMVECPGWNPPLAVKQGTPCPPPPTAATHPDVHYCLGYGQAFAWDIPCPRPPVDICHTATPPLECSATYNSTPPISDAGAGATVTTPPPEAATAPPGTVEVSSAVAIVHGPPRATQRRSRAPRTTTTTAPPPIYFVLGHWLTYDQFVYVVELMS